MFIEWILMWKITYLLSVIDIYLKRNILAFDFICNAKLLKLCFMNCLHQSFSSTGRRPASLCHGGLSVVRACVNFCFKRHLLWNRWTDFDETLQKWSLDGPLPKLLKWPWSLWNSGCYGNGKKKLKKSSPLKPQFLELRYLVWSII